MKVMLIQLDGKLPNLALMRLSRWHLDRGNEIDFRFGANFDGDADAVYASAIFRKTIPLVERLRARHPQAVIGGTGVDPARKNELVPLSIAVNSTVITLENALGIETGESARNLDYSFYPNYTASLGFTQRGCRKKCSFCAVPTKEPILRGVQSVYDIWRGGSHPRHLHLLDNDFFGGPEWRDRLKEVREGGFRVSFNQGINARFLTEESAEAIASVDYRADDMKVKRIYTAWDNLPDEEVLFKGLNLLKKYGVNPDHIMVYMLIGYWPNETVESWEHRRKKLREFGARPYPMPFVRTRETVGFQRWLMGAYDKRFSWDHWVRAGYRPEKLHLVDAD
jgi:hypothetical protein